MKSHVFTITPAGGSVSLQVDIVFSVSRIVQPSPLLNTHVTLIYIYLFF